MDIDTNYLVNSKYNKTSQEIGDELMIKKAYKFLIVGGKVNGMVPPIWLLLRSLPNWGT